MQFPAQLIRYSESPIPVLLVASGPTLFSIPVSNGVETEELDIVDSWTSPTNAYIAILCASTKSAHVVLATAEDKSVLVLEIGKDGKFKELSRRLFSKRPSTVIISPDNETIICGDKFGDVYSLPLIPSPNWTPPAPVVHTPTPKPEIETDEAASTAQFKPTATTATVHTRANLRALESQMQQKIFSAPKEEMKFEHELLLGHVSLLTDLTWAIETPNPDDSNYKRNYLITADRDEHIRVSRAPPHAYITENYCLGHTSFVNKLCLVRNGDVLVSGGGDDYLCVWDWKAGKLLSKLSLQPIIQSLTPSATEQGKTEEEKEETASQSDEGIITLTGLYSTQDSNGCEILFITVVSSPFLYSIPVGSLYTIDSSPPITSHPFHQNVLSTAPLGSDVILISTDPASRAADESMSDESHFIIAHDFSPSSDKGLSCQNFTQRINQVLASSKLISSLPGADEKAIREHLYSAVTLRKRTRDF